MTTTTRAQSGPSAGWRALGAAQHGRFEAARPWPHLAVDHLFDPGLIADAERDELAYGLTLREHRSHRQVKAESTTVSGHAANALLDQLNSEPFLGYLTELSGIHGLLLDPDRTWGGLHVAGPGAFQAVHRDFRRHPHSHLYHRLNTLLYLNSDWSEDFGGHLELWSEDLRHCVRTVSPQAGRLMVFESDATFFHGVPDPVRCPPGRARLALAAFYYSHEPPPGDRREPLLRRPRRPQDPWRVGFAGAPDALSVVRRYVTKGRSRLRSGNAP